MTGLIGIWFPPPLMSCCLTEVGSNGTAVCDAQPIVANATLTNVMSESTTAVLHPGAKATFACDLGHYFGQHVANWTIECMTCGQWSSIPPGCTAVDCQTPPAVPLATANYESTTFGAEVTYMCDVGYRFHGTNGSVDIHRMHCNATGNWTTKSNGRCVVLRATDASTTPHTAAVAIPPSTFLPTASHLWNELPEEIVAIGERAKFKTEVSAFLGVLR
ncbi:hypothetical protein LSAT2_015854 [Lamellibrachia satsuma]|nr:hypothetical protein LSAT2_015854 [Lamellibrachia satsuma]